ncbi:hypothetical protein BU23DRAFT_570182 [Bimuria novae-zelandiae CBS 107.79]|uniref:Uncharacterized protein n=1 Tax=Bimuria novae-zelandiae CBS 107.79 TaxID=1447943 RepID=A0A6A5V1R8_9PLEO|nr:hypothetical protein BU23DRAFT_570182 [Bimuria novae-zelandiae CBS 107.79]
MKVQEKNSDRRAEVHVHVQEKLDKLPEFGQYVEAVDGALCCYIPASEGDVIKTLSIAHDLVIDGVLRKAQNTISKNVKYQKGIKLDLDSVLHRVDCGGETNIIDTMMKVVPVSGFHFTQKDAWETIGTIKLYLYVPRTFGTDHPLDSEVFTYLDDEAEDVDEDEDKGEEKEAEGQDGENNGENEGTQEPSEAETIKEPKEKGTGATYKSIAPDFMIEKRSSRRNARARSHGPSSASTTAARDIQYNARKNADLTFTNAPTEAVDAQDPEMKLTHNPRTKGKGEEPHMLNLAPVPVLQVGAKPGQPDDTSSTRASSQTSLSSTPFGSNSPLGKYSSSLLAQNQLAIDETSSELTVASETSRNAELAKASESTLAPPDPALPARPAVPTPSLTATTGKRPRRSISETLLQLEQTKALRARGPAAAVRARETRGAGAVGARVGGRGCEVQGGRRGFERGEEDAGEI